MAHDQHCEELGFKRGTSEHAQCRLELARRAKQRHEGACRPHHSARDHDKLDLDRLFANSRNVGRRLYPWPPSGPWGQQGALASGPLVKLIMPVCDHRLTPRVHRADGGVKVD
jgi:hypothetical protein